MQKALAVCTLPFSFKIFYGFIADNIAIFGSKKKSWLLIMTAIQFLTMTVITIWPLYNFYLTVTCVTLGYTGVAFADVVVDSLMVMNARKDRESGSSHL